MFKGLVFLGALAIVGLIITGAIKLQRGPDNTVQVQVDRAKVREDALHVIEGSKEVLEEAESAWRESNESSVTK